MLNKIFYKLMVTASLMVVGFSVAQASELEQVKRQVMETICKGRYSYSKELKNYVCRICPSFTSRGMAGSHEEFMIVNVIPGKFLPNSDKVVYYIEYSGCEPHAYNFGGHMVMVDGRLFTHDASLASPLGDCRVSKKQDRDVLICETGFTAQGRTVIRRHECTLDPQKMYFKCRKVK